MSDTPQPTPPPQYRLSEDWLAVFLGLFVLCATAWGIWVTNPDLKQAFFADAVETSDNEMPPAELKLKNPLKLWVDKPQTWKSSPLDAFQGKKGSALPGILGAGLFLWVLFTAGCGIRGDSVLWFGLTFPVIYALSLVAYLLSTQSAIKHYNLEYALWALLVGLLISNTIGTPKWLKPGVRTEYYIKTGLVLLGAEVLFSKLLALGVPGICVAWIVTPIVLISTYLFGQYVLKIESKSLNMVISADMSVCGVSAAIATAAACKAKKEELSAAISMSLMFTVIMMVVMPQIITLLGISDAVGGAWMGGTIDATGAVAAAGEMLDNKAAMEVAATIKMIQNILIGVVSLCVAMYWVAYVEKSDVDTATTPGVGEIWKRFPKFVLGFLLASILASIFYNSGSAGVQLVGEVTSVTKGLRSWCFCLAFVAIGLDTNFAELFKTLKGGKPLILYICGQSLNLVLTLAMAYLMFDFTFPQARVEIMSREVINSQ
ncbi:MAG: putative sulfate exporter family transporter [Planctomycetaceae bacterium]|nr:putative sulfate exporter family transporter [Planctomycetaceae bacterium]